MKTLIQAAIISAISLSVTAPVNAAGGFGVEDQTVSSKITGPISKPIRVPVPSQGKKKFLGW